MHYTADLVSWFWCSNSHNKSETFCILSGREAEGSIIGCAFGHLQIIFKNERNRKKNDWKKPLLVAFEPLPYILLFLVVTRSLVSRLFFYFFLWHWYCFALDVISFFTVTDRFFRSITFRFPFCGPLLFYLQPLLRVFSEHSLFLFHLFSLQSSLLVSPSKLSSFFFIKALVLVLLQSSNLVSPPKLSSCLLTP